MSDIDDERAFEMLAAGHWFLKHRSNGETPHRRFVYTEGHSICWATTEKRKGKIGMLAATEGANLLVVPGAATAVLASKKRIRDPNRLFSIVGATRSLDLEAESEAERHLWVRAFAAFVKLHTADKLEASTLLLPTAKGPKDDTLRAALGSGALGIRKGAALGGGADYDDAGGVHARLADVEGVKFPRLSATLLVLTGDLRGRWQLFDIELIEGELRSNGRGVLPLRYVGGLGMTGGEADEYADEAGEAGEDSEELTAAGAMRLMKVELKLRLRLGGKEDRTQGRKDARKHMTKDEGSGAPEGPLDLVLRVPQSLAKLWHTCLKRSMTLLEDLDAAGGGPLAPPTQVQLLPLRREVVEMELNNLFADAFEACASSAGEAYAALDPLLKSCVDKMKAAACTLPPRRDLYVAYADGVHHRMINIFQVLLVRYDLDRAYLDTDGQETKEARGHHEALEPALMLGLIGWARRYEERMEAVGAGAGRKLLAPEASEALISAYLHACRVLTKQWATNIVFVEKQQMFGDERGGGRSPEKQNSRKELSQGLVRMPGEGGQELWFTELHMDLFRIVHEHIELGIGTGIEVVLFNVIIAQADFLVDVQNEILRCIRSDWRSVGFVYLCSLINNCQRCAELWGNAIKSSKSPRSPLSEALAANLHLGYVADGFVNLGFAAMQLSSHRVLALLEVPIAALFRKGARHSPEAMAALVDQRLSIITDGVASSHAPRAAAICLEQLMCSYGVMLFLSDLHDRAHFTPETPPTLAADLDAFDGLMARHCGASTTYGRNRAAARARAAALHRLLSQVLAFLETVLTPGSELAVYKAPVKADADAAVFTRSLQARASGELSSSTGDPIVDAAARLRLQQPSLTRELLGQLLKKCSKEGHQKSVGLQKLLKGKGRVEIILDQCDAAVQAELGGVVLASVGEHGGKKERPLERRPSLGGGGSTAMASLHPAAAGSGSKEDVQEGQAACAHFFSLVAEAIELGNKFSVVRLLELQQSAATRRVAARAASSASAGHASAPPRWWDSK